MEQKEKGGVCRIVSAGDFSPALFSRAAGDLVIAADAGLSALDAAGLEADLYVGDSDSLGKKPEGIESVSLPAVKDDTDTLAAVREGLARGYRRFVLYGALGGGRFSHSVANLQTLAYLADAGATGEIVDEKCRVTLLEKGIVCLRAKGEYLSLFAFGGEGVVSIRGAKYPLEKTRLSPAFPLGVSNEGENDTEIEIHEGRFLLVRESLRPDAANTEID